jgi:glycosyltransferase involved in cell wall biosynthesis
MRTLSIIMPVLNEGDGIAGALAALAPLRQRGVEVIVVDGGSNDATVQSARLSADRVITAARGRARQMNAGAAAADGEVLLFLHADTTLPPDADRLVLDAIAGSNGVWGRFDVRIDGPASLRVVAAMMNIRSRLTGIATGDVRASQRLRCGRWVSGD